MEVDADRTGQGRLVTRWRSLLRILIALVVLTATAASIYLAWDQRERLESLTAAEAKDAAAVEAATDEAMAWTTVDYRHPEAYFDSIRAGATGDFLSELDETEKALSKLLVENRTVQTANIPTDGAALVERSGDRATVLVTLDATVRSKSEPKPTMRQYRLRLTLVYADSAWRTSQLEFVG
jgi:Mce-associated membrane protein